MRSLWLDYQRGDPSWRLPGWFLLALGMAAAVLVAVAYSSVTEERGEAEADVARLRQEAGRAQVSARAASADAAAAARKAGEPPAVRRWDALFAALESAADDSVTLLSLHPSGNEIQISGEARNFAASMDYLQRLQSTRGLANARLTQSEVLAENPRRPVRFGLVADWRSGA